MYPSVCSQAESPKRRTMWFLGFLLLPAIFDADRGLKIGDYRVTIVDDTLLSVDAIEHQKSDDLDLSGLGVRNIDGGALRRLTKLKNLSLANNSISKLGKNVFAKLAELEYLSLADNDIREVGVFDSPYADLRSLKILNLTNNRHLSSFRRHLFNGLSPSCEIITRGIHMETINALVFNPDSHKGGVPAYVDEKHRQTWGRPTGQISFAEPPKTLDDNLRVEACVENGTLKSLDVLTPGASLAVGCTEVVTLHRYSELHVRRLGIEKFAKGWYRLGSLPILNLDFEGNAISRITPEVLNDLPSSVRVVALQKNVIETLERGAMDNEHLSAIVLRGNRLRSIDNGAFEKLTKIENIFLDDNRLTDMQFVATLPTGLEQLYLGNNEITEVPADCLSKFRGLFNLELRNNMIRKIGRRSFAGLPSLEQLRLQNNRIDTIEKGASIDLKSLVLLDVANNSLVTVEEGAFAGLRDIRTMDFRYNKLSRFPREALSGLPSSLENLWMDNNEIETLETGSFVKVPRKSLTLENNRIRAIESGSFNLPELNTLKLNNNFLEKFEGDSFQGLPRLAGLWLSNNRIAEVDNAEKKLGSLRVLDISNNPLKRLDNDSLRGLMISRWVDVDVKNTPIEILQAGVFGNA